MKFFKFLFLVLFSICFFQFDAMAQNKVNKKKMSKSQKEAYKGWRKRTDENAEKSEEKETKDHSFFGKMKAKRENAKDPAGRKRGFRHAISIQDKNTRKRMRRHKRASKKGRWK